MESIKETLERHPIIIENEALRHGFTQIPNYVLRDRSLSLGARLIYTMLLSYAWQEKRCFPGQSRLAADLGVDERSVRRYLVELRESGYVDWKQRGLGKTNIYYILDITKRKIENKGARLTGHQRPVRSGQDFPFRSGRPCPVNNTQMKQTQNKNNQR